MRAAGDRCSTHRATEDPEDSTLTRRISCFVREGGGYQRYDETHVLELLDELTLVLLLADEDDKEDGMELLLEELKNEEED